MPKHTSRIIQRDKISKVATLEITLTERITRMLPMLELDYLRSVAIKAIEKDLFGKKDFYSDDGDFVGEDEYEKLIEQQKDFYSDNGDFDGID